MNFRSNTTLSSAQQLFNGLWGAFTPEVRQPEREAGHSLPCSAEIKNAWSYTSTSRYVFTVWWLFKQRIYFYHFAIYLNTRKIVTFTFTIFCVEQVHVTLLEISQLVFYSWTWFFLLCLTGK